ncbi:carcinine hydrolase/isopenicillin-N N-acyltransferase family protein [Actinomycetes bacterium KLBMP 9759]
MRRNAAVLLALLAVLVGACAPAAPDAAREEAPTAARFEPLRQSPAEIDATVASLRQLDDHPLYEMTYHGDYVPTVPLVPPDLGVEAPDWACSLIALPSGFARNFDWDPGPAMVVRSDPPAGYASVSVVDLTTSLGLRGSPDLADPATRRALAHAVLVPFDGMNEKGLVVGMAATPEAQLPLPTADKPVVGSLRVVRMMLDRAATVEEAVAVMRDFTVDFTGGPQIHYLIADAAGRAVVVEFSGGTLNVVDDRILTNIAMTGTEPAQRLADRRYRLLAEGATAGADAMELLRTVAQPHTRWSIVYEPASGTARLVTGQRWERVHTVALRDAR